jgi:hypothetical protein
MRILPGVKPCALVYVQSVGFHFYTMLYEYKEHKENFF